MSFDKMNPHLNLPKLPPAKDIETKITLRKAVKANIKLAELKGLVNNLPNPDILINTLGIQEAMDSTEIENIVTTADNVFRAMVTESKNIDPATKEVLRYREALWKGFEYLKKKPVLSIELFENIVSEIKDEQLSIRNKEVFLENKQSGERIYTPPSGKNLIKQLLENIQEFSDNNDDIDFIVKMAIIHYQFEAIHPFTDGNGRTGRIINLLYLTSVNLLDIPILYLSRYIIKNKEKYYSSLRAVSEHGYWESWIIYILDGIAETSSYTIKRIHEIKNLMDETRVTIKTKLPNIYSKDLLEILFKHPYTKVKFLVEAGIGHRETCGKYLRELKEIGILESLKKGRENLYLNSGLIELLSG